MNRKILGFGAVLVAFGILNVEVLHAYGYLGFAQLILSNLASTAVLVDLTIALSLVLAWMWRDAGETGLPFLPYLIVTLVLGSLGPLGYLVHRSLREARGELSGASWPTVAPAASIGVRGNVS